MDDDRVEAVVAGLDAALTGLLELELTSVGSVPLVGLLERVETARRRLVAVDHRLLAEIDQRGVAGDYARSSTADLLTLRLRVAPGEAKARVAQARDTQPTVLPSGGVAPAVLPRCADAVTAGEVSAAHVAVIAKTLDRIPAVIAYEAAPVAEAMLVEAARHQHPAALERTAGLLLARLDPDGTAPREEDVARRREFSLCRRPDGTARPRGEWSAELAAVWQAILDSLAAPIPAADGLPDDRSPGQRRHDAMLEAGQRLLRSHTLPAAGGTPVTVLLRVTATPDAAAPDTAIPDTAASAAGSDPAADEAAADEAAADVDAPTSDDGGLDAGDLWAFRDPASEIALTSTGEIWPVSRLAANLGDVAVVPIVVDQHGAALMCGRTQRFATRAQRLALAARDGGCSFPACTRPAAWCEVHHVIEWRLDGTTDITNLCLVCTYHHREFDRRGWVVQMTDGLPYWLPPPWIDPDQRPIRNTVHHPPDLDFRLDHDVGQAG